MRKVHSRVAWCRGEDADLSTEPPADNLTALNEALAQLAVKDPVKADLVKLRYFAGLSNPQAAEALGISSSTADNYWAYARSWLRLEVGDAEGAD